MFMFVDPRGSSEEALVFSGLHWLPGRTCPAGATSDVTQNTENNNNNNSNKIMANHNNCSKILIMMIPMLTIDKKFRTSKKNTMHQ